MTDGEFVNRVLARLVAIDRDCAGRTVFEGLDVIEAKLRRLDSIARMGNDPRKET